MEKHGGSDVEPLLPEILHDILLRLPAKSLLRFRSVSKLWLSIISDPQFISSFFNRSSAHPKLLLTLPALFSFGKFIFSLDYSECLTENMSQDDPPLSLAVTSHGLICERLSNTQRSHSSGGLVCIEFDMDLVVCNPSTREAITLKRLPPCSDSSVLHPRYINHFGFDPVENKYKILSTVELGRDKFHVYVITLGEENWRSVNDGYPTSEYNAASRCNAAGVCINRVIYYLSWIQSTESYHLIAFDVRPETFKVIPLPAGVVDLHNAFLMESDGCVALVNEIDDDDLRDAVDDIPYDGEICDYPFEEIPVHTLQEVPNQIWISESFPVPRNLIKLIQRVDVFLVVTSHKGELLYATYIRSGESNLYVCNLKDDSVRQIEVDELPKDQTDELRVCSHVDNLVSLKDFSTACWRY